LLFYFKSSGRVRPFPLFGGEGLAGHVHLLRGAHGDLAARFGAPVTELPLDGAGLVEPLPGLHLRTRPAAHKHGALHLGFEAAGRRVVFSGDTGPSAGLVELARGADLLVCECALAAPGEGHLCPDDVAAIVASARPAAVVLHHLYPDVDPEFALDRVAATGVPTHLAHDGLMWADGAWSPAEAHSSASRRRV
jgi:phosphoribosyl 1,2-cyclic phosphodiesterase